MSTMLDAIRILTLYVLTHFSPLCYFLTHIFFFSFYLGKPRLREMISDPRSKLKSSLIHIFKC